MWNVFIHRFLWFLLSFSLRPTTSLESVQQFATLRRIVALRNYRANLSAILAELFMMEGQNRRATSHHFSIF
jgi:hypothetical protein